ncbi:MAG TPA: hypothetical protein VI979_00995 [archaeon]|nr:hypothetical protein [archaeon]
MTDELFAMEDAIFHLLRMTIFILFIIVVLYLFLGVHSSTGLNYLDKANREVAGFLMTSEATGSRGVFLAAKLDEFDGKESEPFGRHCSYAYRLDIETMEGNRKWSFGFVPPKAAVEMNDASEKEYNVLVKDGDKLLPARMKLTLYQRLLTEISCMVEEAYETGHAQFIKARLPCGDTVTIPKTFIGVPGVAGLYSADHICTLKLIKAGSGADAKLCYLKVPIRTSAMSGVANAAAASTETWSAAGEDLIGCRGISDVPFEGFDPGGEFYDPGMANIRLVPVKPGETLGANCNDFQSKESGSKEATGHVYMCVDNGLKLVYDSVPA